MRESSTAPAVVDPDGSELCVDWPLRLLSFPKSSICQAFNYNLSQSFHLCAGSHPTARARSPTRRHMRRCRTVLHTRFRARISAQSRARPDCTDDSEKLQQIADACSTTVDKQTLNETRKTVPDRGDYFITTGNKGTMLARPPALLQRLRPYQCTLGMGRPRTDMMGKNLEG
jgi:hypothetical protein